MTAIRRATVTWWTIISTKNVQRMIHSHQNWLDLLCIQWFDFLFFLLLFRRSHEQQCEMGIWLGDERISVMLVNYDQYCERQCAKKSSITTINHIDVITVSSLFFHRFVEWKLSLFMCSKGTRPLCWFNPSMKKPLKFY